MFKDSKKEPKKMTTFSGLNLAPPVLRALADEGYSTPTPIQTKAIPPLLGGSDLLGVAQTGTGKTAAFALPLLNRFALQSRKARSKQPYALILAPTRELAGQINDSLRTYGRHLRLRTAVIFGGTSARPQIKAMAHGVHILVATPGRLLDLMRSGHVDLAAVETFILDEADRMLDMGFINDVRRIAKALPRERQTLLFSATMPTSVQALADGLLTEPVRVEVTPAATTAERVQQQVLFVAKDKKRELLTELMTDDGIERVLIFTRTKHGADRVARHLQQYGTTCGVIHGNKSQNARQRALKDFRSGRARALVATDIAARGIDVDGVTHVINFELPNEPESYVHRIGRTARAGSAGTAISFCDREERAYLRDIERTIRQSVEVFEDHPFHADDIANDTGPVRHPPQRNKRRRGKGGAPKNHGSAHRDQADRNRGGHRRKNNGGGNKRQGGRPNRFGGNKKAA